MAYVKFYRGLEANLPAAGASGLVEGAFYLTTDTWRLYNVIDDNGTLTPHPLGEKINIVQTAATIGAAADHIGEFAYIESGNVFAVSIPDGNGAKWVQINTQATSTELETLTFGATASNDVATVTLTGHNHSGTEPDDAFTVTAGTGIDVTASGKNVTIAKEATPLTLSEVQSKPTLTVDGGSVGLIAGTGISYTTDTTNKTITITGQLGGIKDVSTAAASTGFDISVTGADDTSDTANIDPVVTLGNNTSTEYHFQNGTMNLPVYTKTEIDSSLTGLNAMVYKGTLGTGGSQTTVPTSVQIGDTYKVVDDINVTTDNGTVEAHAGDLVIARGTEGSDGKITSASLVWDIVRGADDVDTHYTLTAITHGVQLDGDDDTTNGSLVIANGSHITATDSGTGNDRTVTIGHATITQAADIVETAVTQSKGGTASYTAVSDVVVDDAGHVTGLKTKTLTVDDTTLKANGLDVSTTVGVANSTVTVTTGVQVEDTANVQLSDTSAFTMTSAGSTIAMSTSGTNINYDIVWGTF